MKTINIITVDDSKIIRKILSNTLSSYFSSEEWNLNLYEAENGIEAMDVISKHDIHIMLLDWNMPKMNGEEVVLSVRKNNKYKNLRIIMATTEGSKTNVLKMLKRGANGYLVKPFIKGSIENMLGRLIKRMQFTEDNEEVIEL